MPPSLAERLRKAGIRHYDELIHDQKKDWLVKNFKAEGTAPACPVNVSRPDKAFMCGRARIFICLIALFWIAEGVLPAAPLGFSPALWGEAAKRGDIRILWTAVLISLVVLLVMMPCGVFWLLYRSRTAGDAAPEEPEIKWAAISLYLAVVSAIAVGLAGGGFGGAFAAIGAREMTDFYIGVALLIAVLACIFLLPCGVSWLLYRRRWFRTSMAVSLASVVSSLSPVIMLIPLAPIIYDGMFRQDAQSKVKSSETVTVGYLLTFPY